MQIQYLIFLYENEAMGLINQINTCMGWPSDGTNTWMIAPDYMCEFDLQTGDKIPIGYGVEIQNRIIDCLTPSQKNEVVILPSNINTCIWQPEII
jgi:hypothetical protein